MLLKNAMDFIINSERFNDKISHFNINVNSCRNLDIKLMADNASQVYYFEVYFDFGNAGPSTHDITTRVRINNDGSFTFLYFN